MATSLLDKLGAKRQTIKPSQYVSNIVEPYRDLGKQLYEEEAFTRTEVKPLSEKLKEPSPTLDTFETRRDTRMREEEIASKQEKETRQTASDRARMLERQLSDKYGIDVKRVNTPIELTNMTLRIPADRREQFKKDFQEYTLEIERSNPFRAGAEAGFNILPTQLESTQGKEEVESAKGFGAGRFVGGAGQQLAFGSVLGAPLESAAGRVLGTRATPFLTETLKDVAIGTGTQLLEAPFDKPTVGQFATNTAIDIALNALFGVVGKSLSKVNAIDLKNAKTSEIVENVARDMNVTTKEASDMIDKSIDDLMQMRTQSPRVEPVLAPRAEMRTDTTAINLRQLGQVVEQPTINRPSEFTVKPKKLTEKLAEPTPIPEEINEPLLKKFKLDLFGATKEKPVDAVVDGVEVRVTNVFDSENGIKTATLSDGRQVPYDKIKPSKKYKPVISDEMEPVFDFASKLKDVGTTSRYTTDIYRNFEKVFEKGSDVFKKVKSNILDPFDEAKGKMADDVVKYTDGMKQVIVDDLGIKPKSRDSALVMRYGEKRIYYDGLVKEVGKERADKIVKADAWFRKQYDELLDDININRINMNKPVIEKRQDYYRHFNDIANTFENLKNIFESGRAIDPRLSGLSEYTKPREAWASFKQRRTDGTKFTEDAVGGFLDYIRAGTYAKHIDPQISNFRTFRNQLANATTESKNINRFIEYLDDFTNDLAGKTNPFDRWLQKLIGREKLAAVNAINSRVKSNAVLGNISSSLSQIANVPQGIATIKNPVFLKRGLENSMKSVIGKGDANLYKQSSFLKERYLSDAYSQFNMRLIDKPKQAAVWMLGALDEVGTKFIWSSAYAKALKEKALNPIKYADDLTRKLVAGRGIGEVPLAQKSNVMQLVAPFTTEVNNLWKVMQDMGKEKDIAGLTILFIANHILNKGVESVRGSGVTYDPIQAVIDGYDSESTFGDNLVGIGGALAGETLSSLPLGSSLASAYPEYGGKIGEVELPTRAELFGEYDPTRYGISMPLVKAVQDPLKNLLLPFGGAQVSKTVQGAKSVGLLPQNVLTGKDTIEKMNLPASVSSSGKIRTGVDVTPIKTAQALLFGGYSLPEVRQFFEGTGVPFGEIQTSNIVNLANSGLELTKLTDTLTEARSVKTKEERKAILENAGYTNEEVKRIMKTFYGYKE